MDWVIFEEQVVSHSMLHPLFIQVISYCLHCCGLHLLFEAFACRHERKWWVLLGVNCTCFGAKYLYHCMSIGNVRYIIQSQSGKPAFGLPNLGNLLTGPYMGGTDYKQPHTGTLRSKIHCIY